jgi:hypothetical protein
VSAPDPETEEREPGLRKTFVVMMIVEYTMMAPPDGKDATG